MTTTQAAEISVAQNSSSRDYFHLESHDNVVTLTNITFINNECVYCPVFIR